jgi:hypothetical protein
MWSHYNRIAAADVASGGGRLTQSLHGPMDFNMEIAKSNLGRVDESIGTSSTDWAQMSRLLPKIGEKQFSKLFLVKHRMMDNVQNVSKCVNIPLSQTSDLI